MCGNQAAPSERLVSKLAEREGTTPDELMPPLHESVDLEALDALFAPRIDGSSRDPDGYVEFEYGEHRVRVESDGTVAIDESGAT